MAKQKSKQQPERRQLTSFERLGLRVSTMINSPRAQVDRCVTIHRLDTDEDDAWEAVLEMLAETNGVELDFNDDGTITLRWEIEREEGSTAEEGEILALEEQSPF